MIEGVIIERAHRYDAARDDIAPIVGRSADDRRPDPRRAVSLHAVCHGATGHRHRRAVLLPEQLEHRGSVEAEERRRGIYGVPVYTARLAVSGTLRAARCSARSTQICRSCGNQAADRAADRRRALGAGADRARERQRERDRFEARRRARRGLRSAARCAVCGARPRRDLAAPQAFSFDLVLGGTGGAAFSCRSAIETRVRLQSNWASPRFGGAFLPEQRDVTADGFTARVACARHRARLPSSWKESTPPPEGYRSVGVRRRR